MKLKKSNKGFTLIEAIVSIAIAGIVILPLGIIFYQGLANLRVSKAKLKATQIAQSYVEYTKSVSPTIANGFTAAAAFAGLNEAPGYYYEKNVVDGDYNVNIKLYPNTFNSDFVANANVLTVSDQFSSIYTTADTNTFHIRPLGNIVENQRTVELIYKESTTVADTYEITYHSKNEKLDGSESDNESKTQTFSAANITGKFIMIYNCNNYVSPMTDTVSVFNKSSLPLTVYILRDVNTLQYPTVEVKEGSVIVVKDTLFEGVNDRRLYKMVVTVENAFLDEDIIVEATKNQQN